MRKTVSFVARDELAQWLEQRADARMKSVSSICQDIVAREYRRQAGSTGEESPATSSTSSPPDNNEERLDTRRDEIVDYREVGDDRVLEFEEMEHAQRFRSQVGALLSESDDRREKVVRVNVEPGDTEYIMDAATHAHSEEAMETVTR